MVSTHRRLKAAGPRSTDEYARANVSTHSRLKAAGLTLLYVPVVGSFNTQPPKGGCILELYGYRGHEGFNTQPPKGGWCSTHYLYFALLFQHTAA